MKRIGLIAMSGLRAHNEELTRLGLTLPGFVDRNRIIASLPSLGLLTLAGLTPRTFEVEYHEIADLRKETELPEHFDLVAISTFTAQLKEAWRIADFYCSKNIPVVMGGIPVSSLPEDTKEHCASVVVGEGEPLWPEVLDDFERGRLKPFYVQTPRGGFDLREGPMPRFDLLAPDRYNRITVQTSRGCPHRCDFCASSILLTPRYKRLLRELVREKLRWFTEADVNVAEDDELLGLMRDSGCQQVLIGLESPRKASLDGLELHNNWKLRQRDGYFAAIRKIQSYGITVNGCFILGLDGDTPEVFDGVWNFVRESGLYEVQVTFLTAFPGTPLYQRLKREGRIIRDKAWELCTLFDINFTPKEMTVEQLQNGFLHLVKRIYSIEETNDRRRKFKASLKTSPNFGRRAVAKSETLLAA